MTLSPLLLTTVVLVAVAPAQDSMPDRVAVEVDPSGMMSSPGGEYEAGLIAGNVKNTNSKTIEALGVEVVEGADEPTVLIRLTWKDYEGSLYHIEILTRRPGEDPELFGEYDYQAVTLGKLNPFIEEKIPGALEQLAKEPEPPPENPAVAETEGNGATAENTTPNEAAEERRRVPLGPLGKAGIGVGVAGAVGLVAGGVVFGQGRRYDTDARQEFTEGTNFKPPGAAVMVTGGVLLGAGIALLVVDRVRAKKLRKSDESVARWAPAPFGLAVRW